MRCLVVVLCAVCLLLPTAVTAADKSVAEEILDVQYETGQIEKPVYERLLQKARAEEAKRAGQAPVMQQAEAPTPAKKKGDDLRVFWNKGLKLENEDKSIRFASTGRIFTDFGTSTAGDGLDTALGNDIENYGADFRSMRLGLNGVLYDRFTLKADLDFAPGEALFADVYAGVLDLAVFDEIRVGHQKYPLSISEQTSLRFTPFVERSLANDTFYNSPIGNGASNRDTGLRTISAFFDKRMNVNLAGYIQSNGNRGSQGDGRHFSEAVHAMARVTGLPWKDGDNLAHVGLGFRHTAADPQDTPARLRGRPHGSRLVGTRLVDTGAFAADSIDLVNAEAAFNYGHFTLQGEYFQNFISRENDEDDLDFSGYYVWAAYVLNGSVRKYNAKNGGWRRISPDKDLFDGGWGAWEFAARWSAVNLNDEGIEGGKENDFTVGINWHPHTNLRWMLNYGYSTVDDRDFGAFDLDDGDNGFHLVQTRFQVDF